MPIDLTRALPSIPRQLDVHWRPDDVLLYQLAIGYGNPPTDARQLSYATEPHLQVLPTFAVVAPSLRETQPPGLDWPGIDINLSKILHGSQRIEINAPLPTSAEGVASTHIAAIQDKGSAAVIELATDVTDGDGGHLWTSTMRIFARGEGGFGGDRGTTLSITAPERSPDAVFDTETLPQQALLYRLLGDRNPLHSDPEFARRVGFERPILHGLATYGIVLKAAVTHLLDGNADGVRVYEGIFTGIVLPGETIRTKAWREGNKITLISSVPQRDDASVLNAEVIVAGR
ncbi:acyl dehydratase [Jatrophihabitans sp. GAS493]|uniref:MaoC/PaaZ C-terminal domain-containing protein n=1 Tax=Jatrophihabitans sp. GAS493 TaxID=1907575 RepID=UPI000BB80357|nr:MaoC/PaaZ C-terminal domain-containing protein [Jatrophihabitans sp. GAS493]SOD72129.1 acyl dehydratase [Jatrophihabitans sp. GAS493]